MVVDFHTHLFADAYRTYLASRRVYPRIEYKPNGTPSFVRGETDRYDVIRSYYDPAQKIKDMDRTHVDVGAMSPVNPWLDFCGPEEAARLAVPINNEVSKIAEASHGRIVGLGLLPMKDPSSAVGELKRCVGDLGLRGVAIGASIDGEPLSSQKFLPILEAAARLRIPVFVHPNAAETVGENFIQQYRFGTIFGYLIDTALNVVKLIFDGVLERLPELKLVIAHQGAFIPYVIGRIDRAYDSFAECRKNISKPPSYYLRRMFVDTASFNSSSIRYAVDLLGPDRLVFGTDYPFALAGGPDAAHFIHRAVADAKLAKEDEDMLLHTNASKLLKL